MEDKVIVITGASGGIGAALAKKLGSEGHSVVLAARRKNELEAVASQSGPKAIAVVADVTKRKDLETLREAALKKFGRIDVWINNAGRGVGKKILDLTDADFDEIINVNLRSVLYGMQAIVPYFQKQGRGHLINVSSFLGRVPFVTFRSIYNAAKAAVNSLTANMRMDMRMSSPEVKVSLVMPGMVLTDFAKNALGGTPEMPGRPRSGQDAQTPEEVADLMAELIKNPKAELYTNPSSAETAANYFRDVAAFEDNMFKQR